VLHTADRHVFAVHCMMSHARSPTQVLLCAACDVTRVQSDACELVRHLRGAEGMTHIAVHGESIGGMVAAAAARRSEVNAQFACRF
jgi:dienelactone hydrolase